jgi:4-hydroxyproline epimerase
LSADIPLPHSSARPHHAGAGDSPPGGEGRGRRIAVVDSHTEGEPTRVVIDGWGEVAGATMAERRDELLRHHDRLRRAVVCEPRGHDAVVGALLTPPVEAGSLAGVVFFNNVGYLGMCGHGLIGLVRTLAFLGRLDAGVRKVHIDTPVGTVEAEVEGGAAGAGSSGGGKDDDAGAVTFTNVPSYCHARDVVVEVPGLGRIAGDVAWGGNWFFLFDAAQLGGGELSMSRLGELTAATLAIHRALTAAGISGAAGAEIDHIEAYGPPAGTAADCRNFVLCPGGAYDRSPCGTGTSAKLATLFARGELALGQRWRQESVTGGLFTGWLTRNGEALVPHIRGRAFVTGQATLYFDPSDPFREGLPES